MEPKTDKIKITLSMSSERFYRFLKMIKKNDKELFEIFRTDINRQIKYIEQITDNKTSDECAGCGCHKNHCVCP